MSFKENLLKKIRINDMAKKIRTTIGPSDSDLKIDKEIMRSILELSPYQPVTERDLELFIRDADGKDIKKIVVLDNELPIYVTTIADVAMRKSPTLKEMINIRNAIKIINDKDVKISRKEDSLEIIRKECIEQIDLSFDRTDLNEIEKDGLESLDRGYTEGVIESLSLFADLLEYQKAPKPFRINHYEIFGVLSRKNSDELLFGPVVIYHIIHNVVKFIDEKISGFNENQIKYYHDISTGKEKAAREGNAVFHHLKEEIIKKYL